MMKKNVKCLMMFAAVALLFVGCTKTNGEPQQLADYEYDFFSEEEKAALLHKPSDYENQVADEIIANTTMRPYAGKREYEAQEYSYEAHKIGCQINDVDGMVWVKYTEIAVDKDGDNYSSSGINCVWYVENNSEGEWEIVKSREHP